MHWLLLDAASECEDQDTEIAEALKRTSGSRNVDGLDGVGSCEKNSRRVQRKDGGLYLHDLTSIQLFVYLMAPLVMHLQVRHFATGPVMSQIGGVFQGSRPSGLNFLINRRSVS